MANSQANLVFEQYVKQHEEELREIASIDYASRSISVRNNPEAVNRIFSEGEEYPSDWPLALLSFDMTNKSALSMTMTLSEGADSWKIEAFSGNTLFSTSSIDFDPDTYPMSVIFDANRSATLAPLTQREDMQEAGLVITRAGGVVPFQAEGFIYDMPFYFRCRHGNVSLRVGGNNGERPYSTRSWYSSFLELNEDYFMDRESFVKIFPEMVKALQKSDFFFGFQYVLRSDVENLSEEEREQYEEVARAQEIGDHVKVFAFGATAEEAYNNLFTETFSGHLSYLSKLMDKSEEFVKPVVDDNRTFTKRIPGVEI